MATLSKSNCSRQVMSWTNRNNSDKLRYIERGEAAIEWYESGNRVTDLVQWRQESRRHIDRLPSLLSSIHE